MICIHRLHTPLPSLLSDLQSPTASTSISSPADLLSLYSSPDRLFPVAASRELHLWR